MKNKNIKVEITETTQFIFVSVVLPEFNELRKNIVRVNPQELYEYLIEKKHKPGPLVSGNTLRNTNNGAREGYFIYKNNKKIINTSKKYSSPSKSKSKRVISED